MPRFAELALQAAILERGVGMVILPGDVGAWRSTIRRRSPAGEGRPMIRPTDADLDDLAERIAASRRPMIFGGEGTRDARAEVLRLSQLLQAPVGYAYRGKDVLEADNPTAVGMTGLLGWGGATRRWPSATCCSCSARTSRTTRSCRRKTIIQVDDNPAHSAVGRPSTSGSSATSARRCGR